MDKRVIILIPAFNEAETIRDVIHGLRTHAPGFERLVINDGSTDDTDAVLVHSGERQLKLPINLGYGLALQTGMTYALREQFDVIVTFDADGQHRPADVSPLVSAMLESSTDVLIGSRYGGGHTYNGPLGRRIGMTILSLMTRPMMGRRIRDTTSGFKAMTAEACGRLVEGVFLDFHIESLVRLSLLGFQIAEFPVTILERKYGHSMHSIVSAFQYPLRTLLLTLAAVADALIIRRKP